MNETRTRRTIRLGVAYDGTNYAGWQRQKNGPSIQAELERAVAEITGETALVHGAGRTDAGVHARGQVASFRTSCTIPAAKFPLALSSHLPEDIAVWDASEAPASFHPRKSATGKVYRYTIHNTVVRPVLERFYAAHVRVPLDENAMRKASARLVGVHDFSAFVTDLARRKGNCVRTIRRVEIARSGSQIAIEVEGDGFLYNMVRTLAGSLVEVGRGKVPAAWLAEVLTSRDRRRAGPTAPACGLCLERVLYDEQAP